MAIPEGFKAVQSSSIPKGFKVVEPAQSPTQQAEPDSFADDTVDVLAELAAGANRSVAEFIDFLGPDTANAILSLSGSEARVPTLVDSIPGIKGGFMEEGLGRDIARAVGETAPLAVGIGGAIRQAAKPATTAATGQIQAGTAELANLAAPQSLGKSVAGAMSTTPTADVGYGAVSALGGELGEEVGGDTGKLVGALVAPVGVSSGAMGLKGLLGKGVSGAKALATSLNEMSDEGAGKLLAEAMVRENMSPDDVARAMRELGPEGMPADLGDSFNSVLKTAINKLPRIQGQAREALDERQAGQAARLVSAFEDGTGTPLMNVDDEIARLNLAMKPKISEAYDEVRASSFQPSEKLSNLLGNTENSVGRAAKSAERVLADRRAIGEDVKPIDIIDETKRVMGDQIGKALRQGENARAMNLTKLKNAMVEEADEAIPGYKTARDMFAGKVELEDAAKVGSQFLKLNPREVKGVTDGMSQSEKKMFKLGAKQAIEDKLDNMQITSNAVKRLFGKGGDAEKLKAVFDTPKQYADFREAMEKEARFAMTRQAAQGQSATKKFFEAEKDASNIIDDTRAVLGDPLAATGRIESIISGLAKGKNETVFNESLEKAGDLLITANMNPEKVISLIKKGNVKQIEAALNRAVKNYQSKIVAPSIKAATAAQTTGE